MKDEMDDSDDETLHFHQMGLDDRLLKAISDLGWKEPTLIQEKAIPLALQGKDVLARARTGSGKTAAYAIPLVQKILTAKRIAREQKVLAIVMAPTRELCNQASTNLKQLTACCSRDVKVVDISGQVSLDSQKPILAVRPDIVIGPPSRLLGHVKAGNLFLRDSVETIVLDEADLLLSFGYESDIKQLLQHLPKIYQAFLMSATLSDDVQLIKKLVLHNPAVLKLEESDLAAESNLTQYHIKCEEEDKFVLLYALMKLRLISGRSVVFVNSVDKCYRLKLYLQQFSISGCVLNSEMPVNSRCHIVNQFNDGLYDMVIAADEVSLSTPSVTKKHKRIRDKESGVSRGIDFQNVSNVINFDFPLDVDSYVHRVGRTARGDMRGTALSFVALKEQPLLDGVEQQLGSGAADGESVFKPYQFKMEELDGFRYRARDVLRSVTKAVVREARLKEIKSEILKSEKLKSYFEDNPRDLQVLRHDKCLHSAKQQPHMKNVPDYLVPKTLKRLRTFGSRNRSGKSKTKHQARKSASKTEQKYNKRKADPLKTFDAGGMSKARKLKR